MKKFVCVVLGLFVLVVVSQVDWVRKGSAASAFNVGHVHQVIQKVKQHFPDVALSHVMVTYDYSVLRKVKSLAVLKLSFYVPHSKLPSAKKVKKHARVLMLQLGHKDLSCMNVFVDSNKRRYVSYKEHLHEIKIYFACG